MTNKMLDKSMASIGGHNAGKGVVREGNVPDMFDIVKWTKVGKRRKREGDTKSENDAKSNAEL